MPSRRHTIALATLLALFGTGGCGWVDATGRQAGDGTGEGDRPATEGVPVPPSSAAPLALTEGTPRDVRPAGTDAALDGWRWRTLDEPGEPGVCARFPGFDAALAERALGAACSDADDCALDVAESRDALGTRFTLALPPLRAPVAVRVALTTVGADGRTVERRQTLCGLSVNEAPEAGDDRYRVALGETLRVSAGDPDDLLSNDVDDVDVRNAPLSIDPRAVRTPRHAALFELGADGGFVYRPRDDALDGARGDERDTLEDSFSYRLGDGVHEVIGEVVIVVSDDAARNNRAPRATGPLPDVEIALDPLSARDVRVDLSGPFVDPDGDALGFAVAPGSLPPGGTLAVEADGTLVGRPGLADIGRWRVTLIVDDGRASIERDFTLSVVRAFEANAAPTVTDIANRVVGGRFAYDVAPFFDDPDGDRLRFSASGLPRGVSIDAAGLIAGRSRGVNRGRWFVVVTATDERGATVADGFALTIVRDDDDARPGARPSR